MSRENLPIWRACNRLLVETETAVRGFSRYNKYTLGHELRLSVLKCSRVLIRALNANLVHRLTWVERLQVQCDDVKLLLQLAKELSMFASFSQFQVLSELAVSIGKQVGQWRRKLSAQTAKPNVYVNARAES